MTSFERSRKQEKTRHEKRAIIVSIKSIHHCHHNCSSCGVLLGLGSGFVLGFTTDDIIRVTNLNPNPNWQLYKYKRSVTFDLSLGLLTLTLTLTDNYSYSLPIFIDFSIRVTNPNTKTN